jgi:hypothetical protein
MTSASGRPSLYNHVGGRDELELLVAFDGMDRPAETCRTAVMGRAHGEALRALAHAFPAFAAA